MKCPRCANQFGYRFVYCPYDGKPLLPEAPDLDTGRALPELAGSKLDSHVRLRAVLGRGAMATVYLGQNIQSGAPVAVKLLHRDHVSGREMVDRFRREAEAIGQLEHPNIVRVFETGELKDGTPYLVLERLFGETLNEALEQEGEMPLEVAVPILQQAASALWAVHDKGMVHRDVKPENIYLVGQAGQLRSVKVLDFGLSRLWNSTLTSQGTVIGTPQYIAPEQVVSAPADQRTDVYALGMVMYRMMTGRVAFPDAENMGILACQLHVSPPAPRQLTPDLDPRCDLVIRTATKKRPEQRYASMQLFAEDLRRLEQPKAQLWAHESPDEPYEPATPFAAKVAETMRMFLPGA